MVVLGIETTCDETAAAVVERPPVGPGRILSNVVLSQIAEHAAFGGVVPEIAARAHVETLDQIIAKAMAAAGQVPDPDEPPTRAATGIGRSMLVDPLGVVRIDLGPGPGMAVAEVDEDLVGTVRAVVPSLANRREDVFGAPVAIPGG